METVTKLLTGPIGQKTSRKRAKLRRKPSPPASSPLALEDDLLVLANAVPSEEWAKVPSDLNDNLDHYLYGSPKKSVCRVRGA